MHASTTRVAIRGVLSPDRPATAAAAAQHSAQDALSRLDALHSSIGALRQRGGSAGRLNARPRSRGTGAPAGDAMLASLSSRAAELRAQLRDLGFSPPSAARGATAARAAGVLVAGHEAAPPAGDPWWCGGAAAAAPLTARSAPTAAARSSPRRAPLAASPVLPVDCRHDTRGTHIDTPGSGGGPAVDCRSSSTPQPLAGSAADALLISFVSSPGPSTPREGSAGRSARALSDVDGVVWGGSPMRSAHVTPMHAAAAAASLAPAVPATAAGRPAATEVVHSTETAHPSNLYVPVAATSTSVVALAPPSASASVAAGSSTAESAAAPAPRDVAAILRRLVASDRHLAELNGVLLAVGAPKPLAAAAAPLSLPPIHARPNPAAVLPPSTDPDAAPFQCAEDYIDGGDNPARVFVLSSRRRSHAHALSSPLLWPSQPSSRDARASPASSHIDAASSLSSWGGIPPHNARASHGHQSHESRRGSLGGGSSSYDDGAADAEWLAASLNAAQSVASAFSSSARSGSARYGAGGRAAQLPAARIVGDASRASSRRQSRATVAGSEVRQPWK